MRLTQILLPLLCSATIALSFTACSTAGANTSSNQSNTATAAGSNAAKPASTTASDKKGSSATICDVVAYVSDKDPKGLNVRDSSSESGAVIAQLPLNKGGTEVHIISSSSNGWVMIDRATADDKSVFDKKGWVSGNLLAVAARGYDTGGVPLYEAGKGSKVLTKVPEDTEVKIAGCDGNRMQVKYKDFTGWLEPDARCETFVTRCN